MAKASKAAPAPAKKAAPAPKSANSAKTAAAPSTAAPAKKSAAAAKTTTKAAVEAPVEATAPPAKAPAAKAAKAAAPAAKSKAPALVPPKSSPPKSYDAKFMAKQLQLLTEERATYVASAEALKAEADQLAAEMEPGDIQFDDESGEGDTMAVDRERDLMLSAQARGAIEEIDHALGKIAGGSYGACERCGNLIPKARLEAIPHAALCVDCKQGGLSRR